MPLLRYLLGRPLSSQEQGSQQVGVWDGVAVFGLDALGSAAYGPEAALTVLISIGLIGSRYIVPLAVCITALLLVVYLSYRQTLRAYPNGGGAYTVAGQNLGPRYGMLAGAALMLDYLLNVCVGISTGIGALISAVPRLQVHTLGLCLAVLSIVVLANLRGTREAGTLWMLPTYAFVGCLLWVVATGCVKTFLHGGHPEAIIAPSKPVANAAIEVGPWLLLRAFASGCTALTGVEAVSNGVRAFREPRQKHAARTLTFIVTILGILIVGLAVLIRAYGITATEPGQPGYQSVLSITAAAVMGHGWFYYVTIGSILLVLSLSANTSFAGFPQLCSAMAEDGYLPRSFTVRGRRLAYTTGIVVLAVASAGILAIFGGVTDRLIPLFAIGAFLAFTFSQAGMVSHWIRQNNGKFSFHALLNGFGALCTGATTVIVFVTKFRNGAWLTALILAVVVLLLGAARKHSERVERLTQIRGLQLEPLLRLPMMILPVSRWNKASLAALQFACSLSDDVRVLHIADVEEQGRTTCQDWERELAEASQKSGIVAPRVVFLCSPYRSINRPIMSYVAQAEVESPDRKIAVVLAEVVAGRWYHHVMHNYGAMWLKLWLYLRGRRRVAIIDMPWQLPAA